MRSLLSTTELRHLKFIELLLNHKGDMHLKDVAKALNCSDKILLHDVNTLEGRYPFIEIHREKQYISMSLKDSYSIAHVYARAINQSLNYRFLKYIFFHPENTFEEVQEYFDISQATLYRNISTISRALKENFHLKLKSKPFRIIGPEQDIRQFYSLLFFESHDVMDWPFTFIDEEALSLCFKKISELTKTNFYLGDVIEAKIGVAINIQRLTNNQLIGNLVEDSHIQNLFPYIVGIPEFQALLQQLPHEIQHMSMATIISELFYPFISSNIIYDYETILFSPESYPTINWQLMKIHTLAMNLADKYHLRIDNISQFIIRVHNTIAFNTNNLNQSYFIHDYYQEIFDYVDSQFPDFSKDLDHQIYHVLFKDEELSRYLFLALKRSILLNWEDLFLQLSDSGVINILIIDKFSMTIADFYRKFLRFNLPKNVNVMVWRHFPLNVHDLANTSHEIIITNLMLPKIPGKKVLYMDSIFAEKDLKRIASAAQEVRMAQVHQGGLMLSLIHI